MKIEIVQPNDYRAEGKAGQKSLLINGEVVMSGTKSEILEKINEIYEAWF